MISWVYSNELSDCGLMVYNKIFHFFGTTRVDISWQYWDELWMYMFGTYRRLWQLQMRRRCSDQKVWGRPETFNFNFSISRMIETGRYYTRSERLAGFLQIFSVYISIYFWSLFKIKIEIIYGGASPWWCVCLARRHSVQPHPEGVHQTIIAITRYFTRQSFTRQVFSIMCIYRRRLTPADLPHCQRFEVISP